MIKNSFTNDTHIKVVCRIRPLNELEKSQGGQICVISDTKSIKIKLQGDESKYEFAFDNVFSLESSQTEIFEAVARPVIESVMNGFNGTIFAYGQTSSGKTFTMEGPSIDSIDCKGIIPRMMDSVFENILNANENFEFTVKVSFLEIYNEKIQDLLDIKKNNLHVKEDRNHGIFIQDVTEIYVHNSDQMKKVMKAGSENRTIAATRMNERSSRSHSIFILSIFQKDLSNETSKQSRLFFVDLAGSEKIAKTNVTGQQLEEAKNINKSLSALGNVINALTAEKKEHIPYRDSKLTRLLQDSLGGNSKTTLILACSPCSYNDKETLGTLRFGQRAKSIKNKPVVNEEKSVKELIGLLELNERKIKQQEIFIEKLQGELNKRGIVGFETKIITETLSDVEETKLTPTDTDIEIKTSRLTPRDSEPTPSYEAVDIATIKKYSTNTSNNTMKLLKQHIHLNQLTEQVKIMKMEKKELENEITNQKSEIDELNEKFTTNDEYFNNLINKFILQIQNLQVSFEKMTYENQSSVHLISKLKRELNRLKTDFNFLLLSHSLKEFEKPNNNNPLSPRKREDVSFDVTKDFVEDQTTFFEKINENILKILGLIESIEEISMNISNYDYSFLNSEEIKHPLVLIPSNRTICKSNEEDNVITPVKVPMLNIKKVMGSQWESTTNTNRDNAEENESQENREFLAMTERKRDEYEVSLEIKTLNKNERISKEIYEERMEKIKDLDNYEEKITELKDLIANQRKTIASLTKMNQELTFTVESYNNLFEKKADKYKKKLQELKVNSIKKAQEHEKIFENFEQLLSEKQKEFIEFKNKSDKEIVYKTNEICELKLHLDHLQEFLSQNKETKFLMECDKKIKDLGSERQKLFNELFKLKSGLEEKTELICEKNNQITILQNNINTLVSQLSMHDYEKHSKMLPNLDTSKKDLTFQKNSLIKGTGFIDKHIIRPLRGGGGNLQNFQKKNYLLDEESDTSEPENNFEISEFNEFSFKKKKNDSKLNLELQKQTTKIDNINITSAFEEDLNQYYSKNQKSEVEKKFMKIQQAHIKKEGQAPTTNKSMKNIFSSVKKIFS